MRSLVGACIAALVATTLSLDAVASVSPHVGTRVRLTATRPGVTPSPARPEIIRGSLLTLRPGEVTVTADASGETLSIPLAEVTRFETSRGVHGNSGRGAVIGLMVGFLIGMPIGLAAYQDQKDEFFSMGSSTQWAMAFGAGVGALGALTGAVAGAGYKSERWEAVAQESLQGALDSGSGQGGPRLAVRVGF